MKKTDARGRACLQYSVCAALLREAAQAEPLSYEERADAALEALKHGAQTFSAKFAAAQLRALGGQEENVVLSPVSVYAGLSLAAACAQGETQTQLLSALGVDQAQLSAGFSPFYRSLTANAEDDAGKLRTRLHLANAVYVNEGTQTKDACLDALASDFFCNSYAADFMNDNDAANEAVRRFVREETNGLIDSRFLLPEETVFAGSPGPDEYEEVYLDFTVDRAFVFLLTDRCGTILFAGIIGAV